MLLCFSSSWRWICCNILAWRKETAYAKDTDWVFAISKNKGKTPRVGNMIIRDYLYPAAVATGVLAETKTGECENEKVTYTDKKGKPVKRFGFHSFRHSLSSFLTVKGGLDPMTAQVALRQSNAAFTLNKYTQTYNEELVAGQNLMLDAIFQHGKGVIQ
jgi:integrase